MRVPDVVKSFVKESYHWEADFPLTIESAEQLESVLTDCTNAVMDKILVNLKDRLEGGL